MISVYFVFGKLVVIFIDRLVQSENVQYFQFDKYGNMYVYEPGSGFSGESKLVAPGFEMGEIADWSNVPCSLEFVNDVPSTYVTDTQVSEVDVKEISDGVVKMELAPNTRYISLLFCYY